MKNVDDLAEALYLTWLSRPAVSYPPADHVLEVAPKKAYEAAEAFVAEREAREKARERATAERERKSVAEAMGRMRANATPEPKASA